MERRSAGVSWVDDQADVRHQRYQDAASNVDAVGESIAEEHEHEGMLCEAEEASLWSLLRTLDSDVVAELRQIGLSDLNSCAAQLVSMFPDEDMHSLLLRCEGAFRTFVEDGLPKYVLSNNPRREMSMGLGLSTTLGLSVPESLVAMLRLGPEDIQAIVDLSTMLNSAPATVAVAYAEHNRNVEATYQALC